MQFSRQPKSLLGKVLSLLLGATFLVLAVMFSVVVLTIVALGGVIFAGWFWWKTRALRKAMQAGQIEPPNFSTETHADKHSTTNARVIEGEFVRETGSAGHLPNNK